MSETVQEQATAKVVVLEDVAGRLDIGIGWNHSGCLDSRWPEYLGTGTGSTGPSSRRKFSQQDWDRYFGLLEWSGCHWLRHAISIPDWKPGDTGRSDFSFASGDMQRHYTVLDQAEKRGIKVLLANWNLGTKRFLEKRRSGKEGCVRNHPDDQDAFSGGLAALVHHLKREKKYECVWALSLWNEPDDDWACTGPNAGYPDSFWPLYGMVDSHMRRLGVRDDVLLFGPDTSTGGRPHHVSRMLERHGPVLDIIGDHDYAAFRGKSMFRSVAVYSRFMRDIHRIYGKRVPFVISEFGNYGRGSGAVDDDNLVYSGALSTTAYLIRMINHGAAGLARWEFLLYGTEWRNFGALTATDPDYIFRPYGPVFYPHAITARYVRQGWTVRKVRVGAAGDMLSAAALTSQDGDVTMLLLNDDIKPISLRLAFDIPFVPDRLHRLVVTGPKPERIARDGDLRLDRNGTTIVLPPESITALTSLPPGNLHLPEELSLKHTSHDDFLLFIDRLNRRMHRLRRRTGSLGRCFKPAKNVERGT